MTATDLNKTKEVATALGVDVNHLLAVMWCESKLKPEAVNPSGGASGLIQFTPSTARGLGTSVEAIRKMSFQQQLPLVYKYLSGMIKQHGRPSDFIGLYSLVFYPPFAKAALSATLPQKWYNANKGMDVNKNGVITKQDFKTWAENKIKGRGIKVAGNTIAFILPILLIALALLIFMKDGRPTTMAV